MSTTSEPPDLTLLEFMAAVERHSLRAAAARLSELEAEVARLRDALEPFASDTLWLHRDRITDDDLRNARAALEERTP